MNRQSTPHWLAHPSPLSLLQSDFKFSQVKKIRNPQQRLRKMMDLCKKSICEGSTQVKGVGDDFPEEDGEQKEHAGGCGSLQPSLKVEGMKIVAEFKPPNKKDQDEVQLPEAVERKQVWYGDKVRGTERVVCAAVIALGLGFLALSRFGLGSCYLCFFSTFEQDKNIYENTETTMTNTA